MFLENMVKSIVPSGMMRLYYVVFAKEVYRVKQRLSGATQTMEVEILQDKWVERGLDINYLHEIKQALNVPGLHFRLDISLLDGPDLLS